MTHTEKMEQDFIQFCFCRNRMLLESQFRPLFDALKEKYAVVWEDGRVKSQDLFAINDKFLATL